MQAVRTTIRCTRCGCIALPDAIKCPKCGEDYRNPSNNAAKEIIDSFAYLAATKVDAPGIKVIRAYYQISCPHHGQVYVRATVTDTPVKCPFCSAP
jgi:hypothetical protein